MMHPEDFREAIRQAHAGADAAEAALLLALRARDKLFAQCTTDYGRDRNRWPLDSLPVRELMLAEERVALRQAQLDHMRLRAARMPATLREAEGV